MGGGGMGMGGFRGIALGSGTRMGGSGNLTTSEADFGKAFDPRVLGRLWRYAAPFKLRIWVGIVLLLINTLASVVNPLIPGLAINEITRHNQTGLFWMCIFFLINNTILWLSQFQQVYQMTWVGQHALYRVASDMFNHVASLSLTFFDENETGRVMARMQNDVTVLQQVLSNGMISIFGSFLSLIGIMVFLFVLQWELALLVSISIPVMAIALWVWQRAARRAFLRARDSISEVNATIQENVSGARVIQSLTRERQNSTNFQRVNDKNMQANVHAGKVTAFIQPLVAVVSAIALAVAVFVGGLMVRSGALELGFLVSYALYINRFFDPIRDMTQQYSNMQRATVAAERIFEILDWPQDVADAPDAIELTSSRGEIEFRDVHFGYKEGVEVLHGLDIHVQPGEHVAFVGPTGAGKTTVISLLARFYDVTGGAVLVDGHDVREVTMRSLRSQMGIVLQDPFIFSGTIRGNIAFGKPGATDAEVEEVARAVGLHDLIMRMEKGYDTPVLPNGANLSLGQRQLISFARVMLPQPKILMLDEATAGIDTQTEALLQRGVARLMENRTTLIIAHRLSTVRDADRIIVIDHGRVAEEGNHAELMRIGGMYANLYTMGFRDVTSNGRHGTNGATPQQQVETSAAQ